MDLPRQQKNARLSTIAPSETGSVDGVVQPTCKFTKLVTVEIKHCAKSENVKMKFVRAVCSQAQLPYTFKPLRKGGDFNSHSSYGVIQVDSFSALAITQEGSVDREYCSQLFYLGQPNSYKIHFVVTCNLEAQLTVSGVGL